MKKSITLTIAILFISFFSLKASEENNTNFYGNGYGKSYIFVVQNVEFSVFPDGQFDFTYIGNNTNVSISSSNVSYNSGYNYEMFVQYDDYGGVIQIEEVPIYYDEYGRIAQAGDVEIRYANRRIARVGGLFVHYNYYGYYSHCTGYINPYNYYYVYRPWHVFYARPVYASCVVYDYPYRRYYAPTRYDYYDHNNYYTNRGRGNVSYTNGRRSFYKPGSRVHNKNGRSVANRDYNPNRRNTAVAQSNRQDPSNSRRENTSTVNRTSKKTNNSNSKRVASNYKSNSSRGNTSTTTRTQKTSYKRNVSSKKSNTNYSNSNRTASSNNSTRSYTNKENSNKRIASTSQKKPASNSKSNTRGTSSKRGRGL